MLTAPALSPLFVIPTEVEESLTLSSAERMEQRSFRDVSTALDMTKEGDERPYGVRACPEALDACMRVRALRGTVHRRRHASPEHPASS
jgi:hypothetical protein